MKTKLRSPYLSNTQRLADVIAAIQVMATYKFYKLDFESWADRISADTSKAAYWQEVFEQHPEFFRRSGDSTKVSLVWRRQFPRRFDVDKEVKLTKAEYDVLPEQYKTERISRNPLDTDSIEILLKVAVDLHSRALQLQQEKRWWLPVVIGVIAFVGAILAAILKK